MPYISIKTKTRIDRINLEELNKKIAQGMDVDRERIMLSWEIFTENGFYRYGKEENHYQPVVVIRLSKRNGKEFEKKLATVVVEELCQVLKIPKEDIVLFIHAFDLGKLYLNGEFV